MRQFCVVFNVVRVWRHRERLRSDIDVTYVWSIFKASESQARPQRQIVEDVSSVKIPWKS